MSHAIEIQNLTIQFDLRLHREQQSLKWSMLHRLAGWLPGVSTHQLSSRRTFLALSDINLKVEPGEVVGLLGHNGAGKSTLLMALAGIYAPDIGTIRINGKVGTLLTLGAGFNGELTGRENIILAGLCMGLDRRTIEDNSARIVEFADIGEFIDAPLRTYSNGMRARLGFAVAIQQDPDILLIDEVIATGDADFRRKAGTVLDHFRGAGKTIILVSHNARTIQDICNRAVLLNHGRIEADGTTKDVLHLYLSQVLARRAAAESADAAGADAPSGF